MGRILPNSFLNAIALVADDKAWFTCVEFEVFPTQFARLCDTDLNQVVGGFTFRASAMQITGVEENAEGALGNITIAIPNVSGVPQALVDSQGAVLGNAVKLWLVHSSDLSTLPSGVLWEMQVMDFACTFKTAQFECGFPPSTTKIPSDTYSRDTFPQIPRQKLPR